MSMPNRAAGCRLNRDPREINLVSCPKGFQAVTNLRFHFNASGNILVAQRFFQIRGHGTLPKTDELAGCCADPASASATAVELALPMWTEPIRGQLARFL